MWLWDGKIVPEPGEDIHWAAVEACRLARHYGGFVKSPLDDVNRHVYFEMSFNGVVLRAYPSTHHSDLVEQYNAETRRKPEPKA